jgi:hypothetical protein
MTVLQTKWEVVEVDSSRNTATKPWRELFRSPKTSMWCFSLGFRWSWLCVMIGEIEIKHKEPCQTYSHHERTELFYWCSSFSRSWSVWNLDTFQNEFKTRMAIKMDCLDLRPCLFFRGIQLFAAGSKNWAQFAFMMLSNSLSHRQWNDRKMSRTKGSTNSSIYWEWHCCFP